MCLFFTVRVAPEASPILRNFAKGRASSSHLRLTVRPAGRWPWMRSPHVEAIISEEVGCSCSLLTDDADWNAEHWSMRADVLERLVAILRAVHEAGVKEFTAGALWVGDSGVEEQVSFADLLHLVATQRLGTKVMYRVST
jgi:hypothetical protein